MRIFGFISYSRSWLVSRPMASRSLSTAATKCQPNIRRSSFRRFMRYGWQFTSVPSLNFANKTGRTSDRLGKVHAAGNAPPGAKAHLISAFDAALKRFFHGAPCGQHEQISSGWVPAPESGTTGLVVLHFVFFAVVLHCVFLGDRLGFLVFLHLIVLHGVLFGVVFLHVLLLHLVLSEGGHRSGQGTREHQTAENLLLTISEFDSDLRRQESSHLLANIG